MDLVNEGVKEAATAALPFLLDEPAGDAPAAEKATSTVIENGEKAAVPKEGIYEGPAANEPEKTYVGQSGRMTQRIKEQQAPGGAIQPGSSVKTTAVPGGKTAREIAEHKRIKELGGVRSTPGSQTSNKRNPIGAKRKHLINENKDE